MLRQLYERPAIQRLVSELPPGQLLRFLGVGVWNKKLGYVLFAVCTYLLSRQFPRYGYIVAGVISSVIAISFAFLGYKWLVFKTKGNYWQEWLRCMAVYGTSIVIGLILLPCFVYLLRRITHLEAQAPYVAAALLTCFNALLNFFGNKKFSFNSGSH
jgi:putative flippase GtrA